jgi:hypothetical protein
MSDGDFGEDPFLSSSHGPYPQNPTTPIRSRRGLLSSGYSLPAPPLATPNSSSNSTNALESSPRSRMDPSSTPSMSQWKAQMTDRPASLPMLPFATRGFRNPDTVPAFHPFETTIPEKLFFEIQLLCSNTGLSGGGFRFSCAPDPSHAAHRYR